MTRLVLTGAAAMCAAGLSLHAQDRPAPQTGSTISVVGCVQQADADGSLAGTPLGTSVPPEQAGPTANRNMPWHGFVLADARPTAAANGPRAPAPVGTTGTAGANPEANASPLASTYALDATTSELEALKGQRVEVSGTVTEPEPSAAGSAGSRDAYRTGVKRLKVTSMKSVAATCDPPQR